MNSVSWSPGMTLDEVEKQVILAAYQHYQGHKTMTASSLGISIKTLYTKLELYESDGKKGVQDAGDRLNEREQFLKRQRGFSSQPDGSVIRTDGGDPGGSATVAKLALEGGPVEDGLPLARGNGMESASQFTEEREMSVSERKEVQGVLPRQHADRHSRKNR